MKKRFFQALAGSGVVLFLFMPATAEELYSCLYNGTSSTYRAAEATRMRALGAVCDRLTAAERVTCAIDGVKLDYSREESRRLMNEKPDAVCETESKLLVNVRADASQARSTSRHATFDMIGKEIIYFRLGSSRLSARSSALLAAFSRKYGSGSYRFTITGYADASGSSRFNHTLSLKRAGRVRDALIDFGISADNIISVNALGEESLRYRTRNGQPYILNRAVEIRAYQ